jgi:hypothetical protein
LLPVVAVLGDANLLTAAFKDDVNALSTAAVSGSVVELLVVVLVGLISCNNAFSAAELKLVESVVLLLLPVPKSALTCWPAIVELTKLLICPADAPFKVLLLKPDGNNPAL